MQKFLNYKISLKNLKNNPNKIIVHHTGGSDAQPLSDSSNSTAQDIDSWHKERWPGFTSNLFKNDRGENYHVGYHFVIEKNGKIVQCRDYAEEGAHTYGQNKSSIGICLSGNFDLTLPTKAQEKSFRRLYNTITAMYPHITSNHIFPHRKFSRKTCYGKRLTDSHFSVLVQSPEDTMEYTEHLKMVIAQLTSKLATLLAQKRYSTNETNKK